MRKNVINFDRNASYGLLPEVQEYLRTLSADLNPSSIHSGGQAARAVIEEARAAVHDLVGAGNGNRVIFTSGATESNNLALLIAASQKARSRWATSLIEHPSVLHARWPGLSQTVLPLDDRFESLLSDTVSPSLSLLSTMLANNETGEVFDVARWVRIVKDRDAEVVCHTDAVQAVGKMPVSFKDLGVDLMSVSAHKIGGLTGTGALVVRDSLEPCAMLHGGPQEMRWRAGTENVLGIGAFGVAARRVAQDLENRMLRMRGARDFLRRLLVDECSGQPLLDASTPCLPNTLNIRLPGVVADDLVVALDLAGVYVSSGAACASGKPEPSHVLLAMGLSEQAARSSIRVSVGADHSDEELQKTGTVLVQTIQRMRGR